MLYWKENRRMLTIITIYYRSFSKFNTLQHNLQLDVQNLYNEIINCDKSWKNNLITHWTLEALDTHRNERCAQLSRHPIERFKEWNSHETKVRQQTAVTTINIITYKYVPTINESGISESNNYRFNTKRQMHGVPVKQCDLNIYWLQQYCA